MERVKRWARLCRDFGALIGVPVFAWIALHLVSMERLARDKLAESQAATIDLLRSQLSVASVEEVPAMKEGYEILLESQQERWEAKLDSAFTQLDKLRSRAQVDSLGTKFGRYWATYHSGVFVSWRDPSVSSVVYRALEEAGYVAMPYGGCCVKQFFVEVVNGVPCLLGADSPEEWLYENADSVRIESRDMERSGVVLYWPGHGAEASKLAILLEETLRKHGIVDKKFFAFPQSTAGASELLPPMSVYGGTWILL